jgi:hypothetical protein
VPTSTSLKCLPAHLEHAVLFFWQDQGLHVCLRPAVRTRLSILCSLVTPTRYTLKLSIGSASSSSSTSSTISTSKVAPTFEFSTTWSKPKEARIGRGNGRGCRRMNLGTVRHGRRGLQLSLPSSTSELRVISNSLGTCSCVGAGTLVLPLEGGGIGAT